MAARIVKFRSRAERLTSEQAGQAKQLLLGLPGLPEQAVSRIVAAIDNQTASQKGWTFVMLSPHQNAAVVSWLHKHSSRRSIAPLVWAEMLTAIRIDTGEVMLSRTELADRIEARPNAVTDVLRDLETIGAISRQRDPQPGQPGRSLKIFINPNVATHLTGASRDEAQTQVNPVDCRRGKK